MCVNNLPRVALDSGEARIRTRDLFVASPAYYTATPPSHTPVAWNVFRAMIRKLCAW